MFKQTVRMQYDKIHRKRRLFFTGTFMLLILLFIVGFVTGPGALPLSDLAGATDEAKELQKRVLLTIRLPRLLAAVISGMALAVSGVIMQSVLRNPLGSPFTLGISNAAAFGASLAITLPSLTGFIPASMQALVIPLSAFAWSLAACFFILSLSKQRNASPVVMVLAGIIASTLFAALTSALQFFADDARLASIVYWSFGDLSKGSWKDIYLQISIVLPVTGYFIYNARHFNALNQGDDTAQSLGLNVKRFRLTGMILASLVTASIVSVYGLIAFVGLVIPHIVRRIIGGNEIYLIPAVATAGAAFLLLCDIVSRTVLSPVSLPVGIVTSVIGAPVFLFLMIRSKTFYQWRS